jgi:hypothetical protein
MPCNHKIPGRNLGYEYLKVCEELDEWISIHNGHRIAAKPLKQPEGTQYNSTSESNINFWIQIPKDKMPARNLEYEYPKVYKEWDEWTTLTQPEQTENTFNIW